MQEYHHAYSNREFVVEHWRKIVLGDFWLYNSLQNAGPAYGIILDIFRGLLKSDISDQLKEQLIHTLLEFIAKLSEQEDIRRKTISVSLNILNDFLEQSDIVFIHTSGYFKTHLSQTAKIEEFSNTVFTLTRNVLKRCIVFWESTTDVEKWFNEKKALFHQDYEEKLHLIGKPFFENLLEQINQAKEWNDLKPILAFNDIANQFRRFEEEFQSAMERIYYIFYLLHLPGMYHLKDNLLWDINPLLKNIRDQLNESELITFSENILALFEELKSKYAGTVLDCILTLGKEVIDNGNQKFIEFFEKKLIEFGFVHPGTIFISDDWQIQVNINHIKNIRVWLELIEYAPSKMKKLLSALIVNLRLGGIFISDTDLFQRDVTKLLNSDIAPLYKLIKQLARIFPVYFNEIGAEGELREVTTSMDELSHRHDRLIHFLRKQTHIESNNTHINLVEAIMQFWYNRKLDALQSLIPLDVYESIDLEGQWITPVHKITRKLCKLKQCKPVELFQIDHDELETALSRASKDDEKDKKRVMYLIKLHGLISEKYSFETGDIIPHMKRINLFKEEEIQEFAQTLDNKDNESGLKQIYHFMKMLSDVFLNPAHSEGWENIYHKRHIAVGIPSMYGKYHEQKFEALGLTFRLEKVASRLMERTISAINLDYITAGTLRRIYDVLALFQEGLELDGISNEGFNSTVKMFKYSLSSASFSLDQFVNIFQFMAENIKEIIDDYYFRIYDQPLRIVGLQSLGYDHGYSETQVKHLIHQKSEKFYREILSSTFLIQTLDNFVTNIINTIRHMVDSYSGAIIQNVMTYDPELIISPLCEQTDNMDNPVFLGAKAYFLKKLHFLGFPIPPGFVLTTEIFRHRDSILKHDHISREFDQFLKSYITKLEQLTGQKFGSPKRPLLFSVRSGTAISMPGAMNTFLNVGMNDSIVKALCKQPGYHWTAWDCYRRFLQSWGMSYSIERDIFDQVIIDFKSQYKVEEKIQFNPDQMRQIAFAYKKVLHDHDIHFEDDPFLQLKQAILNVFDSWSSERARIYREHLQVADEWGTAVIVQKMVLGNLNSASGTGVVFTFDHHRDKPGVNLYGDFTLCSQGEDIVAGLVHALPVTEYHRKKLFDAQSISLESSFPFIYRKLLDFSTQLVEENGYSHQEIEFTFENDKPEGLYILQTRAQNIQKHDRRHVFTIPKEKLDLVGRGIGIGGGALNGILAFNSEDLEIASKKNPGAVRILVRPDTVPDDIGMIFNCEGLLTGKGGATSHAAVTAVRLGKVCIVGCRDLLVNESDKTCTIKGRKFKSGDKIAIDGHFGNIYSENYPTKSIEVNHNG